MSRTYSKAIGSICVVATALALSVSTPASSKNSRQKKPSVNQPTAQSFRYNAYKDLGNVNRNFNDGRSNRNQFNSGQPTARSFRYNTLKDLGNNNNNFQTGFPFADSFGVDFDGGFDGGAGGGNIQQSGGNGNSVVVNDGLRAPLGLQITGTFVLPRPPAKIISVTDDLKALGNERAERRRDRLNNGTDNRVFRFYRDNEAYDERFPSVVYLK